MVWQNGTLVNCSMVQAGDEKFCEKMRCGTFSSCDKNHMLTCSGNFVFPFRLWFGINDGQ
jgi:hypothetical protein